MRRRTENVAGGKAMIGERSDDVELRMEMPPLCLVPLVLSVDTSLSAACIYDSRPASRLLGSTSTSNFISPPLLDYNSAELIASTGTFALTVELRMEVGFRNARWGPAV